MKPLLIALCSLSLFAMVHVFGFPLLPHTLRTLSANEMIPEPGTDSRAFSVPFPFSASDAPHDRRSRVALYENDFALSPHAEIATVVQHGQGNYAHRDGRLIFSATDSSDPRHNGRRYDAYHPVLYQRGIGYAAAILFALSVVGLYRLPLSTSRAAHPPLTPSTGRFRLHVIGAAALLLLGLYCSTGTLSPYGNNGYPLVATSYKFVYNPDHAHFRALFQFVDGQPQATWDGALFLRRILFPVLTYPFMKIWGFEIGGAIGSLALNTAALVAFLFGLRRFIGDRAAVIAGWILAFYPGAAYWGGLPYVYSIIFPACLLMTLGLLALRDSASTARVAWISSLMGCGYLGYDLIIYFLPVSLFVLFVRRCWSAGGIALICQIAPLAAWLSFLRFGLHQDLNNSNSAAFGVVLGAYQNIAADFDRWWALVQHTPGIALNTFFGSGFVFLSGFFLMVLALNPVTSRIRFSSVEVGLLGLGAALFLFNNLAPEYTGPWQMRGNWIARIYQPVFPALVLFCARALSALPPLPVRARWSLGAVCFVFGLGNALVIFGPILNNPFAISEQVFFAFADSMAPHSLYEDNLQKMGRRPLGFPFEDP